MVGVAADRSQWNAASPGTGRVDVGRGGGVRLDSGHDALPLGTDRRVAHAVETKDEQALKVDADHEHRLQQPTSRFPTRYTRNSDSTEDETGWWSCDETDGRQTCKRSHELDTRRRQETKRKTTKDLAYDVHRRSSRFWSNTELGAKKIANDHQRRKNLVARCSNGKWRN